MTRYVELNHVLEDGMAAYPGLPAPRFDCLVDHAASRARYDGKAEFCLSRYELPGNVGTYLDSPFHRYPDRADLSQVRLDQVAGLPGLVLDITAAEDRAAEADFQPAEARGRAVLLRSGWDRRWGSPEYRQPGPFLAPALVDRLLEAGTALVGVDFWNVDDTLDLARPVHTRLLAADVPIVEHLTNLEALPREGFRFTAVPLRIVRGASIPVRAYAELLS